MSTAWPGVPRWRGAGALAVVRVRWRREKGGPISARAIGPVAGLMTKERGDLCGITTNVDGKDVWIEDLQAVVFD